MTTDPEGLGRRIAQRYVVRGLRPKPSELARALGVEVVQAAAPPPAQPTLRAEYQADPPRITLYRAPLAQLSAAVHAAQRLDMLACSLEEVHIAHELFHHLEFGGRFGLLGAGELEAAAHSFTRELCELQFDPGELSKIGI